MVGTPCFGGQVSWLYVSSLLKLQQEFLRRGMDIGFLLQAGDALITRARQTIVAHFLDNADATHLLFIDADIGFDPSQVFRLLDFDADMTAAAYPVKEIDWPLIPGAVQAGRTPLESAALNYVVEGDIRSGLVTRNGFVKSRYAGTGFLLISRSALLAMIERYPELRYTREHKTDDPLQGSPWRSALFNCTIDEVTGTYLSEDFSFCQRWTDMGGEIWVDLKSRLNHVGPMIFRGNLAARVDLP
ncbi:conserved hypothetical protein [Candidatus Sulfopaludibacter sp. SbA3]|nr:conserved hypothetical protein [Candidatus Sulfopaludibacter sp. SbA3]